MLSPTYQTLLEDYLSSLHQAESTISGKAAVVRRYLSYLHLQGRDTPSDWSIRDLKQFILETIDEYNSKSHLLSALRDFHAYLSKCGAVDFAYETAMMCPSTPRKKVLPCFTEKELSQIFYSIDTSSAVGKRDCSPSTQNQRLACIRSFYKYAGTKDIMLIAYHQELMKVPLKHPKL